MLQVRLQSLIDSFHLAINLRMERRLYNSLGAKQNCYFLPKRTREFWITICNELTTQPMKTKDMVNVEFSEFLRRYLFLASHKVNQLSELVNENTYTIVTPARLRKLDNKIVGSPYAKASPKQVTVVAQSVRLVATSLVSLTRYTGRNKLGNVPC
jgi:hypothetical protein